MAWLVFIVRNHAIVRATGTNSAQGLPTSGLSDAALLRFKPRFNGVMAGTDRDRFVVSDTVREKVASLLPGNASAVRTVA